MYVLHLSLSRSAAFPLLGNALYERIAEVYQLPLLETLLTSLNEEVKWPPDVEAYYLDNLVEARSGHLFQIRFKTSLKGQAWTSCFLSMQESQVHSLSFQFPARGDRGCSSRILAELKSIAREMALQDVPLLVEGFLEIGEIHAIKESKLSAFVWIEALGRYLHRTEDPRLVKEVRKGLAHL